MSTSVRNLLLVISIFLIVGTFNGESFAQRILIFDDNSSDQAAQKACTNLGYTFTLAGESDFVSLLTGQTWDLVVMDMPSNSPLGDWQSPLANHINGGGLAIQTGWDAVFFTSLAAVYEVILGSAHDAITLYQWNSHSLFTTPNTVPSTLMVADDEWGTNGFYLSLTPMGSAIEAGGFTASPTAGQAAIAIGNSGRTIFNGFLFDDYYPADADSDLKDDIVELIENEMMFLINQIEEPPVSIPTLSEWGMIIMSLILAGSALWVIRRRLIS